ncbi:polyprenyl synthetase family protein [Nisaea sp.]|uniref:polyprenyl synthetase family protein n=1 Tax=Nisaea sp. TaxID=2024842 RepID=UPI0032EB52B6
MSTTLANDRPANHQTERRPLCDGDWLLDAIRESLFSLRPESQGLGEVLTWHFSLPGGMNRARLGASIGLVLGLPTPLVVGLTTLAQAVHEASLLIDDVNDRSLKRRGQATAWTKFGEDRATLSGIRLLTSAQRLCIALTDKFKLRLTVSETLSHAVERALDGQAAEITQTPSDWDQYDWIAARKTGALMALPVMLVASAAGTPAVQEQRWQQQVETIGLIYQLADDIRDGEFTHFGWKVELPTPQQRIDILAGGLRTELEASVDPVSGILLDLLDELLS